MIKYIGSKRRLLPAILSCLRPLPGLRSAVDLFSGSARVGHALKGQGLQVTANDHNAYAATLARCYVEADEERHARPAAQLIAELARLPGRPGYFTRTFCEEARFFQPFNGERVDAIREEIGRKGLEPVLESVLLTSLMEAADRVDSTTGVQMAYVKEWAPRSHQPLELRLPALLPRGQGQGRALQLDALEAAREVEADLCYLDPPYNQHRYLGNYHIWETLVRWDAPPAYGVARKREDVRQQHSPYNSRPRCAPALGELIGALRCRYLLVSFSNEGFISRPEMEALLARRGRVSVLEQGHPRYVGARIGIYNPSGEKVGQVGHLENKEYLYLVEVGEGG